MSQPPVRIALALLAALSCAGAQAAPVTWQVNATFSDGGTLAGSFTFDAASGVYSSVDMSTSGGSQSGLHYQPVDPSFPVDPMRLSDAIHLTLPGEPVVPDVTGSFTVRAVAMRFDFPISEGISHNLVLSADTGEGSYYQPPDGSTFGPIFTPSRTFISGTVTAVPLPGAAWLLAPALGLLGFRRKRQPGQPSPIHATV